MLSELEKHGAKYYDNGVETEIFQILKTYGVNAVRLRIWNDPCDKNGNPYGGGMNDFSTTIRLAEKIVQYGMKFLLNIHYSDFWTDPAKQMKPKAWRSLTGKSLETAVYDYTYNLISELKFRGLTPDLVQVGNELTNGFLWPDGKLPDYDGMIRLLRQGSAAVRKADSRIGIILHLDNGGKNSLYREWFGRVTEQSLDYDLIGLSYYPYWHGTLDDLTFNMNDISEKYHKNVMIVETAYGFTTENLGENMIFSDELAANTAFSPSKEGQKEFLSELTNRLKDVKGGRGKGFFYWEPEWLPIKGISWATKEGRDYIGDDSSGGNTWSNQALFDFKGNALPALKAIRDL